MLKQQLDAVEERIDAACRRSGRKRQDVTLIAVTKVFPAAILCEAYELGLRDFGENYVQEFARKLPEVGNLPGARFHLIGHLQSNKAKIASELFDVIQTVDSVKLAQRLGATGKQMEAMIEVKLSSEDAKVGVNPEEIPLVIEAIRSFPELTLSGLMTMPPWSDVAETSRPYFKRLGELASRYDLPFLSMGMSHDFEVAIEEGATHIRVGTALFGRRQKQ